MKKLRKSLAVLLAIIMLASFTPMFASAATAASKANCTLVETPQFAYTDPTTNVTVTTDATNTNITVPYGITYDDIEVIGGKITYNGTEVEGYFDWFSRFLTRQPSTGVQTSYRLYFYPSDTTTYSNAAWSITDITGWPTITVDGLDATVAEPPEMSAVTITDNMVLPPTFRSSTASGGKVVDSDGNEITGGSWTVTYPSATYIYCNTAVSVTWTCAGYDPITTTAVIPVNQNHSSYTFEKAASLEVSGQTLSYSSEQTWESLKINEAIIKDKNGNLVEGTYSICQNSAGSPYTGVIGVSSSSKIVYIFFTPADSTLPSVYFIDTIGKVNKANFTLTADSELVLNYGAGYESPYYGTLLQFSNLKTEPAEAGVYSIYWAKDLFDPSTADYGSVTTVTATVTPNNKGYNTLTLEVPVRIQNYQINAFFAGAGSETSAYIPTGEGIEDSDLGLITYKLNFTNKRLKGEVKITATDGTNTFDIATVTADENGLFSINDKWQAPADGEYVFTFTYVPSEDDTATFTDEKYLTVTTGKAVTVDMKELRTITVKIGSDVYTQEVREGKAFWIEWEEITSVAPEAFDHWVITDANGKECTVKDRTGGTFDVNERIISIMVGATDLTFTAVSASGDTNMDGASGSLGSLWSFWQKLVDWLVSLYRTIVELLIPTVETF